MQVSVETTSGLERRMTVQIPADQIDQQVESQPAKVWHRRFAWMVFGPARCH